MWRGQPLALAAFIVIGALIAYFVPSLPNSSSNVFTRISSISFQQLAALALLAGMTIIYLAYYRARWYFSNRWLAATVTYNALLLFVKFTLSTNEFANQAVKTFYAALSTALLISLLYMLAFALLYLFFDGKLLSKSLHKALIVSSEGKVLLAMGLFLCATVARVVVFRLPFLSSTFAASYLGGIFKTNAMILSALIFIMCIAAVEAYSQVRRRADLKYFFWSGLVLILTFHVWWAIFVYRGY